VQGHAGGWTGQPARIAILQRDVWPVAPYGGEKPMITSRQSADRQRRAPIALPRGVAAPERGFGRGVILKRAAPECASGVIVAVDTIHCMVTTNIQENRG